MTARYQQHHTFCISPRGGIKCCNPLLSGASDYGNKFGEPVITGYARSFGMRVPKFSPKDSPAAKGEMERVEWIKPIMFTGGIGQIDNLHIAKGEAKKGMLIIKIGGPAYRIGMGGGAASSMFQGENAEALDFNAVQRGDAEMLQRVNRVIRACVELGEKKSYRCYPRPRCRRKRQCP
mmetsp:Transcript_31557/g.50711  ORF Transcript_31557/g.50711 Transcript_31557/m.50711 type:complete len:178 (+) Transcript_31557:80-613(+)